MGKPAGGDPSDLCGQTEAGPSPVFPEKGPA